MTRARLQPLPPIRASASARSPVRRPATPDATVSPAVRAVIGSSGQPLDPVARAFFESRFGHDFRQVEIHADPAAAASARAIGAQAYTVGNHVVFGAQHHDPQSRDGRRLLAHELAHVVQQGKAHHPVIQRQPHGTTNYRFDTYRVTAADLTDPDIVARFRSLSVRGLFQYRDRVSDPDVIEFIERQLDDLLRRQSIDQIFADLRTETPAVRSFVDQWLTTHAPTSYEIGVGVNPAGDTATAMTLSGIAVAVQPDEYVDEPAFKALLATVTSGEPSALTRSITVYTPRWQPHYRMRAGLVTTVSPTTQRLSIKTVYLRGTPRTTPSGYGVGTRTEDTGTGRSTLAHHEGAHASCFVGYVTKHAPPAFAGTPGDTTAKIEKKADDFKAKMTKYYADMTAECGPSVDCTGTKASFCP